MLVGLLARILIWTFIKRSHLWVLSLSSRFTFPVTEEAVFGAKTCSERLLPWAWVCLQSLFQGVSQKVSITQASLSKWQWVTCCFVPAASLSWKTTFLYKGNEKLLGGRQSYENLQFFIPQVSVVQQMLCMAHGASRSGQGLYNTTIQVQQALRGEANKMWPGDRWAKINFEGLSSVFKNRSNDKIHCWKTLHKTRGTKAHLKKLFVFSRTICIKIAPL